MSECRNSDDIGCIVYLLLAILLTMWFTKSPEQPKAPAPAPTAVPATQGKRP